MNIDHIKITVANKQILDELEEAIIWQSTVRGMP
jgi:hypothetical protein